MILILAKVPPIMNVVMWLWVLVAISLILIVLIQKGKGGGLGAAFGGGAGGVLGTKTGDFLTWVTIGLVVLFLFLAVIMAKYYRPKVSEELKAPVSAPATVPAQPENTTPEN